MMAKKKGRGRPMKKPVGSSLTLQARAEQMEKLRARRWTLNRIGQRYGLTRERVRQILQKRGVTGWLPLLPQITKCKHCGTEFDRRDRPTAKGTKYCSNECGWAATAEKIATPKSKWSRIGTVTLKCSNCGAKFERSKKLEAISRRSCEIRGAKRKNIYCSQRCYFARGEQK